MVNGKPYGVMLAPNNNESPCSYCDLNDKCSLFFDSDEEFENNIDLGSLCREHLTGNEYFVRNFAHQDETSSRTHKVSINNLEAVRERLCKPQDEVSTNPLDLISIELTRECAEWLLSDIAKRRKALEQSVADPHTKQGKRDKKIRELNFVTYSTDIINSALKA